MDKAIANEKDHFEKLKKLRESLEVEICSVQKQVKHLQIEG